MKRTTLIILLIVWAVLNTVAQPKWNTRYQSYVDQYKDLAIEEMLKYRIPASITLAQGLLESGAGMSELTRKSNNHFGIKCHGWTGRTSYHDDDERGECFRAYDNAYESYEDHCKFLSSSPRYSVLFNLSTTDYKGWAKGLKKCGYATSPTYAEQLIGIIEVYKLNEYDRATKYDKFLARHNGLDNPANATGGSLHQIYQLNKNYYVVVRQGDTFKSLGKELDISWRKLARYNELDKRARLEPGSYVFLKKKQSRAEKQFKNHPHRVRAGESMYDIAQHYGIRLKSLYKLNHMSPDFQIQPGDLLRVR